MLILLYLILALAAVYLLIYLYQRHYQRNARIAGLKYDWGKEKNSRYFDLQSVEKYFYNTIADSAGKLQLISDKLCDDLYLNALFKIIDRTISRVGQQYLYARIRTIDRDTSALLQQDALAEEFSADETFRIRTQLSLQQLEKTDAYYFQDLIYAEDIPSPAYMPLVYLLGAANALCLLIACWHPGALLVFLGIFVLNSALHYHNKTRVSIRNASLGQFLKAYATGRELQQDAQLRAHFPGAGQLISSLAGLKTKMTGVQLDNLAETDAAMVGYLLFELIKIAFNLEMILFYTVISSIQAKKEELKQLFIFIGTVDTALSIAAYRSSLDQYCKPVFGAAGKMELRALTHPLISRCVPNDLVLDQHNLLLTGSNMSGKTTFIRAAGVNMVMAQTLLTCTARQYTAPYSKIFSAITIADSLLEDKSYYFEEMRIMKEFITEAAAPDPCFFILDELFKGTNTLERVAAGKAILSYLAAGNHLVFVSTHDTELNALLQDSYDQYHFSETIAEADLIFDHLIKKGPLKTRNAIRILEINGYPEAVIREAYATVDQLTGNVK